MTSWRPGRRLGRVALLTLCLAPMGTKAEDGAVLTGTLQAIQQRGAVRIGYGRIPRRLSAQTVPPFTVAEVPGLLAAYAALAAGRAAAFASGGILLSGLLAMQPDSQRFRVVGDYLSYEPHAIAFHRDDPAFGGLVRQSFERMARDGTLAALYSRWLIQALPTAAALNLPMSPRLAEMYRALGSPY